MSMRLHRIVVVPSGRDADEGGRLLGRLLARRHLLFRLLREGGQQGEADTAADRHRDEAAPRQAGRGGGCEELVDDHGALLPL
jgi:hypothetical protein